MAKRFWLDSTELLASHPNYTSVEWKSEYQKVLGLHGPIKKYFDKSFPIAQLGSDIAIIKAVPYGIPSLIGFCISNKMYFRTTLSGRNFYATLLTDTGVHSANLISVLTRVGRLALEGILTDPWHTLDVVLYRGACVYGRSPHSKRLILELGYSDLVVDIFTSERKSAHYVCSRAKSAIYQMGWDHREQFALKYTENLIKALKQKENTRYTYKCINLLNDWARDEEARGILCNKGLIPVLSECLCVSDESIHEITVSALLNLSNSSRKLIEFEFNGNKIYQQLLPIFRSSSSVRDRVTILMLYSRLNSFCIMPENIETLIQSFIYDKKNDEAALALVDDQVFDPDDFSFWTVENLEVCQILGFWVLAFCPLLKTEKWSSVGDKFEAFFKKFKGKEALLMNHSYLFKVIPILVSNSFIKRQEKVGISLKL